MYWLDGSLHIHGIRHHFTLSKLVNNSLETLMPLPMDLLHYFLHVFTVKFFIQARLYLTLSRDILVLDVVILLPFFA